MKITLNGKKHELAAPISVQDLLASLGVDALKVAVELNREILSREKFASTTVGENDKLEVVQFVGGG